MFGEEQALQALRAAGEKNPNIAAYISAAEAHRAGMANRRGKWNEIPSLPYAQLKPRLPELRRSWIGRWGEQASLEDLGLAAQGLLASTSREERVGYLNIFGRRPFPERHACIVDLAASDDEPAAVAAACAASNITHPDVRELAFRLVENCAPGRWAAISILDRNFEAGDHRIVVDWFGAERDREVRHRFGLDLRTFWKHHVEPHTESQMLLTHYAHGPCSMCREFTVSRLIELQALPDGIREECAYDANDDVRQMVRTQ